LNRRDGLFTLASVLVDLTSTQLFVLSLIKKIRQKKSRIRYKKKKEKKRRRRNNTYPDFISFSIIGLYMIGNSIGIIQSCVSHDEEKKGKKENERRIEITRSHRSSSEHGIAQGLDDYETVHIFCT